MRTRTHAALTAVTLALLLTAAAAEVQPAGVFRDHMVLQREMPVPVWGWADPGQTVTVKLADQTAEATAGADGKWIVRLKAMPAGGPHEMTVTGKTAVTIKDVLVGEVWLCSGQSNMAMVVKSCANAKADIDAADLPKIRHFRTPRRSTPVPVKDCTGAWQVCSPKTVSGFTAAGFFFGRELHKQLDVPIGLLHSSVGGTRIEAWTNRLQLAPGQAPPKGPDENDPAIRQARAEYQKKLAEWRQAVAAEKDRRKRRRMRAPGPPAALVAPYRHQGGLYNGMIHPLVPYGIRGAIWYQGEANARHAWRYREQLPAMILGWRQAWGQGDFPFLFVQLPNFRKRAAEPGDNSWAVIRESMALTLKTPQTGIAVTIDIGEAGNIHPRNKQDVGKRLALVALAKVYDKKVVYAGPTYKKMDVEAGKVRLHFDHLGGGLLAKGGELKGFAVAGADRKWVWATGTIDGETVLVGSDAVAAPVAVRYAWAGNPECNLYNTEGLPAGPFRTDDWPVVTQPKPKTPKTPAK